MMTSCPRIPGWTLQRKAERTSGSRGVLLLKIAIFEGFLRPSTIASVTMSQTLYMKTPGILNPSKNLPISLNAKSITPPKTRQISPEKCWLEDGQAFPFRNGPFSGSTFGKVFPNTSSSQFGLQESRVESRSPPFLLGNRNFGNFGGVQKTQRQIQGLN